MAMSPRNNFHCETTRPAYSLVKFGSVFRYYVIPRSIPDGALMSKLRLKSL